MPTFLLRCLTIDVTETTTVVIRAGSGRAAHSRRQARRRGVRSTRLSKQRPNGDLAANPRPLIIFEKQNR
ncbi:MAG: hypothetical protein HC853_18515 [Anaerolineae bacterium]|nr:hypothetical protein [Anaerolineae bacterium]